MKAEIKSFHSPDIDINNFFPEFVDKFGFLLQVLVGPQNFPGEESFDFLVCTPKWLMEKYNHSEVIFGTSFIIVFEYDIKKILNRIERLIVSFDEENWSQLANQIAKYGRWEFEGYVPYEK